ncbi:MAG: AmmeMemoRadiSam system protein B [Azospirillaceae bacterium]|nr:AmmeMemoRadiSam system protein B [Azospirillaceae bacterium]
MTSIRETAVAGAFYPAAAGPLQAMIESCLADTEQKVTQPVARDPRLPKAIIVPHAGYIYSGPIAASAYARLRPLRGRITRVVLIGPSHRVAFTGLAVTGARAYQTPFGPVALDRPAIEALLTLPEVVELDEAHGPEHSLEVQLPFLIHVLGPFTLVPIVAGFATPDAVARVLERVWGGPETLIVVSSDLSHYLDDAAAKRLDALTATAIEQRDPERIGDSQACGQVPVRGLLALARRKDLTVETLDLRNSGDTAGDRNRVVGYGAWALYEPVAQSGALDVDRARIMAWGPTLGRIARLSIESGLDHGRPLTVADGSFTDVGREPGAAYVTLHLRGELRGCVGSPRAWRALVMDVAENAFNAAFRDTRFAPLTAREWPDCTLTIAVLTPLHLLHFADEADLCAQLRPGIDGLLIEDHNHGALFLPAVWHTVPDPTEFLRHLKHKAGLAATWWSPSFRAMRFTAIEVPLDAPATGTDAPVSAAAQPGTVKHD